MLVFNILWAVCMYEQSMIMEIMISTEDLWFYVNVFMCSFKYLDKYKWTIYCIVN